MHQNRRWHLRPMEFVQDDGWREPLQAVLAQVTRSLSQNDMALRGESMDVPANFDLAEGYAFYHPAGQLSIEEGTRFVVSAIRYARERGIKLLLIDVTGITGLPRPTMLERFS